MKTPLGWSAPIAFTQGGGSVGFQIGVNVEKLIYIFNSDAAWRAFAGEDKVQFKAAAEAVAGPDTASVQAANGLPPNNLYVYTLSEGAFAGAAIGGQMVGNSRDTNRDVYGTSHVDRIISKTTPTPPYAQRLYEVLNRASR